MSIVVLLCVAAWFVVKIIMVFFICIGRDVLVYLVLK